MKKSVVYLSLLGLGVVVCFLAAPSPADAQLPNLAFELVCAACPTGCVYTNADEPPGHGEDHCSGNGSHINETCSTEVRVGSSGALVVDNKQIKCTPENSIAWKRCAFGSHAGQYAIVRCQGNGRTSYVQGSGTAADGDVYCTIGTDIPSPHGGVETEEALAGCFSGTSTHNISGMDAPGHVSAWFASSPPSSPCSF